MVRNTLVSLIICSLAPLIATAAPTRGCVVGERLSSAHAPSEPHLVRGRFTLTPGKRFCLPGKRTVTFVKLLEDSRCPEATTCPGDGSVRIALVARIGGKRYPGEMVLGKRARVEGARFRFVDIAPLNRSTPGATTPPRVTFEVEARCRKGACLALGPNDHRCVSVARCDDTEEPVCGMRTDGTISTFENMCRAQAACAAMVARGACPAPPTQCQPTATTCPPELNPVCAVGTDGIARTFGILCEATSCTTVLHHNPCGWPLPVADGEEWGGEGVGATFFPDLAHPRHIRAQVELDCASAVLDSFTPGEFGIFRTTGTFITSKGGPTTVRDRVDSRPINASGAFRGNDLSLQLTEKGTGKEIGRYQLRFGKGGTIHPCL